MGDRTHNNVAACYGQTHHGCSSLTTHTFTNMKIVSFVLLLVAAARCIQAVANEATIDLGSVAGDATDLPENPTKAECATISRSLPVICKMLGKKSCAAFNSKMSAKCGANAANRAGNDEEELGAAVNSVKYVMVARHRECSGAESSSRQSPVQNCAKKCKYQHYFAFGLKPGRCSGSKCKCLCEKVGTKCRRAKTKNYHLYENQKVVRRFDYFGRFRQKCEIKVGAVDSAPVSTITNTGGDSAPVSGKSAQDAFRDVSLQFCSKLSHTDPKRSISPTEQMRQRGMLMCASMADEYRRVYRSLKRSYTMSKLKRWTRSGDGGD